MNSFKVFEDQVILFYVFNFTEGSIIVNILLLILIINKMWASLVAQLVKNLPAVQETGVRSLGWEDPLEKKVTSGNPLQYPCLVSLMDRGT